MDSKFLNLNPQIFWLVQRLFWSKKTQQQNCFGPIRKNRNSWLRIEKSRSSIWWTAYSSLIITSFVLFFISSLSKRSLVTEGLQNIFFDRDGQVLRPFFSFANIVHFAHWNCSTTFNKMIGYKYWKPRQKNLFPYFDMRHIVFGVGVTMF